MKKISMKKKNKPVRVNKFGRCFPLLWKKCSSCKHKYRLEVMRKAKLKAYTRYLCMLEHRTTIYVCKRCVETDTQMDTYTSISKGKWQDFNMIKCPIPKPRPHYK